MTARLAPSRTFYEELMELDDVSVLHGPGGNPDRVVVDPIMAASFEKALDGFCEDAEIEHVQKVLAQQPSVATLPDGLGRIVQAIGPDGNSYGLVALTSRRSDEAHMRITGLLTGCTLCVDPNYRGQGIANALIICRMLDDEGLPTWEHSKPSYSPAGEAAIQDALDDLQNIAAWRLGQSDRKPAVIDALALDLDLSPLEEPQETPPCP
jgi:GNAT superfamily N-acetyltransferase